MTMLTLMLAAAASFSDPDGRLITDELADGHAYATAALCLHAMQSGDSIEALAGYSKRHRLSRKAVQKLNRECSIVAWVLIRQDQQRNAR